MHKKVWESSSTKREAKQTRMAAKATRPNFSVGDFVLVAVDHQKKIPKLMPRWTGPYRITRTINEWVYEVHHLVTKKLSEIHCSCLQFYSDDKLNRYPSSGTNPTNEWEFHEENICGNRLEGQQFQLQIKWLGLEEDTWNHLKTSLQMLSI
jgi:hypothetical protein